MPPFPFNIAVPSPSSGTSNFGDGTSINAQNGDAGVPYVVATAHSLSSDRPSSLAHSLRYNLSIAWVPHPITPDRMGTHCNGLNQWVIRGSRNSSL